MRFLLLFSTCVLLTACYKNPECKEGCKPEALAVVDPSSDFITWFTPMPYDTVALTNGTAHLVFVSKDQATTMFNASVRMDKPTKKPCGTCYDFITVNCLNRTYACLSNKTNFTVTIRRNVPESTPDIGHVFAAQNFLEIAYGDPNSVNGPNAGTNRYFWNMSVEGPLSSLTGDVVIQPAFELHGKQYGKVYILTRTTAKDIIEPQEVYYQKYTGLLGLKLSNGELWWRE
jgi:hypothetical protein